jgi:peroxiredoxin
LFAPNSNTAISRMTTSSVPPGIPAGNRGMSTLDIATGGYSVLIITFLAFVTRREPTDTARIGTGIEPADTVGHQSVAFAVVRCHNTLGCPTESVDMLSVGDTAPDFTAPLANGDVTQFTLSDRLDEAPIVLAFFPGAFTGVCTDEMTVFEERLGEFADAGATVYGVSVDTPFALNAFREEVGLSFGMLSDSNRRFVHDYDAAMDFVSSGVDDVAKRSVFVVDGDRELRYVWVAEDPGVEPDYDEVLAAVESMPA